MHVSFYSCTQTHVMHVLVDNGSQLKASEGKGGVGGGGGGGVEEVTYSRGSTVVRLWIRTVTN